jgi:hypothetical protein
LVGLGDQWFDSVVEILHARRYFCPVLFAVYCKSYRSNELCREENGLLRLDEEGPCLELVLGIVTFGLPVEMEDGCTSGSGDFGKLVVKRESNSGIAGGCGGNISSYPKHIKLLPQNTYRRANNRSLTDTNVLKSSNQHKSQ